MFLRSRARVISVFVATLTGSCGSAQAPLPPGPPSPPRPSAGLRPSSASELTAALASLSWWLGDWRAEDGSSEHWIAAAGAIYGVAFDGRGGFEVMIVDDAEDDGPADGKLRFFAMPGGEPAVRFDVSQVGQAEATFTNPQHDFPKEISYRRRGAALEAEIRGGAQQHGFSFSPDAPALAPELEAADRAFAADTAARGIEGWMAAFEPGGWQLLGGKKASGEEVRRRMGGFLAQTRLTWEPVASQRSGDLGFTIGKATFTTVADGTSWRGTYVTLWHRQADGTWKVRFDTGRTVNER